MQEHNPDSLEQTEPVIHVDCNSCGAEMVYSPEKQMMLCNHCGNTRTLPRASDRVLEKSFTEAIYLDEAPRGFDVEGNSYHCNNCGADTMVASDTVAFECPFCGSNNVNKEAHHAKAIRPSGILPFKIPLAQAKEKFTAWIKKGFFAPNNLKKFAKIKDIQGVYIPFWTYDADTRSQWTAMAGYYYYVSETYTDKDGNVRTRQVRRTRWVPASGYYEHWYNDVLVVGSRGISQRNMERIYPFELQEIVNYDSRFILGLNSEVYQIDVKEGFQTAETIIDGKIRQACIRQIPGDTYRSLNINTHKSGLTYKHVLLPVWVAGYTYNKKVYQFLVNGQTGKISGRKPIAWWKVALLILVVGAAVAAAVILSQ